MIYYAAFVPGLQDVIATVVRGRLDDVTIHKLLDGAIIFETACSYDRLNFFCFNNIFAVASIVEKAEPAGTFHRNPDEPGFSSGVLEEHMRAVIRAGKNPVISENNKKILSFRIVFSIENKLAAVNEKIKRETEVFISRASALALNRSRPDTEFWFLYRREGFSVFMKRLTRHASWEKRLHPGELPPPLAWTLCSLAGLGGKKSSFLSVLDPFCGYGSIPFQALSRFPVQKIYASDNSAEAVQETRKKIGSVSPGRFCEIFKSDFRDLPPKLGMQNIDRIITDPPWGLYRETDRNTAQFYREMPDCFEKLLAATGRAVILSAAEEELEKAVAESGLSITNKIPILLSGKKTAIFLLKKGPP
ncbi:MAG: RsmD family RNA methyltransferase [Treponema sp.]|jgi:16S rRNA G966 N2-methylase RsmD|nr:RsmD family RNA methyltransferase [Treponema sp.]